MCDMGYDVNISWVHLYQRNNWKKPKSNIHSLEYFEKSPRIKFLYQK